MDVYINYLRKKLGAAVAEEGSDYSVIMTVRGEGYRIGGKKPAQRAEYGMSAQLVGA